MSDKRSRHETKKAIEKIRIVVTRRVFRICDDIPVGSAKEYFEIRRYLDEPSREVEDAVWGIAEADLF